jgi:hypothetical protein
MSRAVDRVSLAAGLALAALGTVLLLDQTGVIDLNFGWFGAVVAATLGIVLLVSGLEEARQPRLEEPAESRSET